jgi:hypothetical protein
MTGWDGGTGMVTCSLGLGQNGEKSACIKYLSASNRKYVYATQYYQLFFFNFQQN